MHALLVLVDELIDSDNESCYTQALSVNTFDCHIPAALILPDTVLVHVPAAKDTFSVSWSIDRAVDNGV